MISDGLKDKGREQVPVLDIAQVVAAALRDPGSER
jgi:hypothetical protein